MLKAARSFGLAGSIAEYACKFRGLSSVASDDVFDVVIVGGGMVGAGLAAALGSHPLTSSLKVALLDQKVPVDKLSGELDEFPELRVSTLTPASIELLRKCRAWDDVRPPLSATFLNMQVWDYGAAGCLRWTAQDIGLDNMGAVAENSIIQSAFLKAARQLKSTHCFFPSSVDRIDFPHLMQQNAASGPQLVKVCLEGGRELSARLIVGADGGMSRVRSAAGLRTINRDYKQRGVVATVKVSRPTDTAWQRFLPTGPLALLPVRNGFCNVVWTTTPQMAREIENSDSEAVAKALNEALHGGSTVGTQLSKTMASVLGGQPSTYEAPPKVEAVVGAQPRSFPLKFMASGRYVCPRLALIGDAAHVVHPLAGQGVNLGLGDVTQLAEALANAAEVGQDIGDETMLRANYERPRQVANSAMMAVLDGVKKAFTPQEGPFAAVRGFGLDALNAIKPVKNEMMAFAMGLRTPDSILPGFGK